MLETPGEIAETQEGVAEGGAEGAAAAAPEANPIEALALEKGWSRKEDWRGPEDAWRPADEFIKVGLDRARDSSREVRSLRESMTRTERTLQTMHERTVAQVRREAEARYVAAVEAKDPAAAAVAYKEFTEADKVAAVPAGPAPEVSDFQTRNPWFGTNPRATALAQGVAEDAARAGKSAAEQIAEAEREVRRVYPSLFSDAAPPQKPPASVAAPGSRAAAPGKRDKGFSDLPAAAQDTGRRMAGKMGFSLEEYAKTWHAENQA